MTPEQLDAALQSIRWTPDILARALRCDVSLVHAWLDGNAEVPLKAGIWIRTLAEVHEAMEAERPKSLKGKHHKT